MGQLMFYGFGKNIFLIVSKGYLYQYSCIVNIFENWGWKQVVIGTNKVYARKSCWAETAAGLETTTVPSTELAVAVTAERSCAASLLYISNYETQEWL